MANEGSTKPTYSELEAENLRVRGLLQRQWVSVEERLPEKHATYVLVICHGGIVRGAEFDWGFDSKPVWAWPHGFGSYSQVTHWMPLPAPPTFPQSSSPVPEGAESADIGKLDTADGKGFEEVMEWALELFALLRFPDIGLRNATWDVIKRVAQKAALVRELDATPCTGCSMCADADEIALAESGVEMGKVNRVEELRAAVGGVCQTIALYQERSPEHNRLPVSIMRLVDELHKKVL